MYPDFQYLLESLLGVPVPEWLSVFKTFGFLVALSFLAAAWTLTMEFKRKESQGLLSPTQEKRVVGEPPAAGDLIGSGLLGFILGYKFGGIFFHAAEVSPDPMSYIFSAKGHLPLGLLVAGIMAYSRYREKKKAQLPQPRTETILVYPHQRIGEIVMIAAVTGLAGAKIFNAFETWEDFIKNPLANLLSSSGLTFYGGLIVASLSLYLYSRKYRFSFAHFCDAAAPGLILAYGLGRLGCQTAGDGDWGIFNSAYITGADGNLHPATSPAAYLDALSAHLGYFHQEILRDYGSLENVPHLYVPAPSWLPDWIFAMNYPHNVNHAGIPLEGCTGTYCSVLPVGVFPTPLYETVACLGMFALLWALRTRLKYPLQLFGIYLIFNGMERFFIEKIRVNYKYDWGFIHPTQAEIISTLLAICGALIFWYATRRGKRQEGGKLRSEA